MASQGLLDVLDSNFVPQSPEDAKEWNDKNVWFYDVLRGIVKTPNGQEILDFHLEDKNCFTIMTKLNSDAYVSPNGKLSLMEMLNWLSSTRYRPDQGKAETHCVKFNRKIEQYGAACLDPEAKLHDGQKRTYLQATFSNVESIGRVWTDEVTRMSMGFRQLPYVQLYAIVRHACATYDSSRATSRFRRGNFHSIEAESDDDASADGELDDDAYRAFAAERNSDTLLPNAPWGELTGNGKKVWHMLTPDDKKTLIKHINSPSPPAQARQANVMEITELDGQDEPQLEANVTDTAPATRAPSAMSKPSAASNGNDAHPGDPRRMASSQGKPHKRQANTVTFSPAPGRSAFNTQLDALQSTVDAYWSTARARTSGNTKPGAAGSKPKPPDFRLGD